MNPVFVALLALLASTFQTRAAQQAQIAALRHQIAVLQRRSPRRLRLKQPDRLLWILLSRLWPGWRRCVYIVKPDTVIRWHRTASLAIGLGSRAVVLEDRRWLPRFAN